MDRDFYAYKNYLIGIREIPDGLLSYPLSFFSKNLMRERKLFRDSKAKLINLLKNWRSFKWTRSIIEDVFKLAKSFSLRKLFTNLLL